MRGMDPDLELVTLRVVAREVTALAADLLDVLREAMPPGPVATEFLTAVSDGLARAWLLQQRGPVH
jgi:hypothetical protein